MAFLTWLASLLGGPIGDFIIKFVNSQKPPVVVTEAEKVGAAQQEVQDLETSDENVQKALAAKAAADATAVSDPGSLRDADPDSRD